MIGVTANSRTGKQDQAAPGACADGPFPSDVMGGGCLIRAEDACDPMDIARSWTVLNPARLPRSLFLFAAHGSRAPRRGAVPAVGTLAQAVRRTSLMPFNRSHAWRFHGSNVRRTGQVEAETAPRRHQQPFGRCGVVLVVAVQLAVPQGSTDRVERRTPCSMRRSYALTLMINSSGRRPVSAARLSLSGTRHHAVAVVASRMDDARKAEARQGLERPDRSR